MKEIVIAGNHREYLDYIKRHRNHDGIYIDRANQIRGLRDVNIVYTGRYWKNPLYRHPLLLELERNSWYIHRTEDEIVYRALPVLDYV